MHKRDPVGKVGPKRKHSGEAGKSGKRGENHD